MSEPTVRPIWTPQDFADTVRDARSAPSEDVQPDPGARPFWRNPRALCTCCSAWPGEECEPGCLSRMSPAEQERHRAAVIESALVDLDLANGLPALAIPTVPHEYQAQAMWYEDMVAAQIGEPEQVVIVDQRGRHRAEPVGMRPSAARRTERLIVAVAVLLLVCSVGVCWLLFVVVPA